MPKKKKGVRSSLEPDTTPPLDREMGSRTTSLPYLGGPPPGPPLPAPDPTKKTAAAGPPTSSATARVSPSPSSSRQPAVPVRPPAFRPVPIQAPGPAASSSRTHAARPPTPALSTRAVAPKVRAVAPPVRPVVPPTAHAAKPARPEAQHAPRLPATAAASAPVRKPLLATPAAQPARPGTSRQPATATFVATARHTTSPASRRLLTDSARATTASKSEALLFSPPSPRGSARDSPAMQSMCSSRQGSDMSAYSGDSSADVEDVSTDAPPAPGRMDAVHPAPLGESVGFGYEFNLDARPQRRPRSPEDDAAEEAKRCCLDPPRPQRGPRGRTEAVPPTFAEAVRSPPPSQACASPGGPPPPETKKKTRYPPLVVERLPNWAAHFRAVNELLGHPPNARPYQGGIRFLPESEEEYRVVQRYLADQERENGLAWFAYSLPAERGFKVAIRGLPADTDPSDIEEELRLLGYQPEYVRNIKARGGRPGCIFHAVLKRTPGIYGIYDITQFLLMRGVKVEAWRGRRGPAQCHRCQQFRHSSHRCHRPLACVRCGENHAAKDCPRPREEPATCANCGGDHPACNRRCPVFIKEASRKKVGTIAITQRPTETARRPTSAYATEAPSASLMAAANGPTERGRVTTQRRRRKKRGGKKGANPPPHPTSTKPQRESAPAPIRAQAASPFPPAEVSVVELVRHTIRDISALRAAHQEAPAADTESDQQCLQQRIESAQSALEDIAQRAESPTVSTRDLWGLALQTLTVVLEACRGRGPRVSPR